MPAVPSLVAFGSLSPWPAQDQLRQLKILLRQNSLFKPIVESIHELKQLWECLLSYDKELGAVAGHAAAQALAELITSPQDVLSANEKRNIMTMPVTVIAHIVQYFSYLDNAETGISHTSVLESVATGGGIQGFCAGLLSALALASGKNLEEVVSLAATSVKLAFCIGAYIDLEQASDHDRSQASSIAVRWKAPTTSEDIQQILLNHPNTYIAVTRDVRDITVTTPTSRVPLLQHDLSCNGATVLDTELSGRYHTSKHEQVPAKIEAACHGLLDPRFGDQELVRSNTNAEIIPRANAIHTALESILTDHANWHLTISDAASKLTTLSREPFILSIGADAIPQSVSKSFPVVKIKTLSSKYNVIPSSTASQYRQSQESGPGGIYHANAIAVIGMSGKFPGADTIDEFWSLLTEGKSMLDQMPKERFDAANSTRSPRGLRFWGNFVRDIESFDHKFFKKSAREAASMDPQQRTLLEVAYQALESSGYFADPLKSDDIGCYLGACATDYDGNVGSHPPTAYSTTGTLRAFLSGKISHFFGWSGPSLTFDTACSSSAVAIHTACTAIQMGECSQAIAGGVALFTSPYLYENLAAAHFLSPSGATKPFDASADGYCRGEGIGIVVLKKLSDALANGDNVLGVIAGSAVNQNANCVSITVPHSGSQGNLYQRVAKQAGIAPHKVTFVEAHGTGTPVGDPIEMESIRKVFGGRQRNSPLFVSSVKGNIGHLEGASGVAGLIKALLQMEHRTACVQASFKKLNPKIPSLEVDKLCIPTSNQALTAETITACINNYGAAGSNTAMMLIEAPRKEQQPWQNGEQDRSRKPARFPIQIAAASKPSLLKYCELLEDFCKKSASSLSAKEQAELLPSIAFSLARQQNQDLAYMFNTTSTDISQVSSGLKVQLQEQDSIKQRPKELPVILCFGGQVGQQIALSRRFWQSCSLFRFHLDLCDEALRSMGYQGLYPAIFQAEPITDVVALQSAVFATQYASAQAWIDSGLRVGAVVGHSLGQIAALCVSGILSLRDGIKLVAGRASLMREHWGPEPGTMIAVEAEQATIKELANTMATAGGGHTFEVACYNGASSHVLVSDKSSADILEAELVRRSLRHKRLHVTHGFHSKFTDPMIPHLEALASSLAFNKAKIPIETCTDGGSWPEPTARLIAAHTRDPVFFGQAIERIQNNFGACTFLEAGSGSSVISMVRRALGPSSGVPNNFISMELNKETSLDNLADTFVNLWNRGHRVQFWNFHRLQASDYKVLRLPPYQFEKPKHWLQLDMSGPKETPAPRDPPQLSQPPPPPVLIRLNRVDSQGHHFDVDPRSEEFQALVKGHVVLGKAEAPFSLHTELASRAVRSVTNGNSEWLFSIHDLDIGFPLGPSIDRDINLQLQRIGDNWNFTLTSKPRLIGDQKDLGPICHCTGKVSLKPADSALEKEFARYERLTGQEQFSAVLNDPEATSIRGTMIYKVSSQMIEYADFYRNLKSIASSGSQVVGKVSPPKLIPSLFKDSITHPYVLDSFIHVASLHSNCIHDSPEDEAFWLSGVDRIQFGPKYPTDHEKGFGDVSWDVHCVVSKMAEAVTHDIFVYDATSGGLAVLILGARYLSAQRVSLADANLRPGKGKALTASLEKTEALRIVSHAATAQPLLPGVSPPAVKPAHSKSSNGLKDPKAAIYNDFCVILEKIADVHRNEVRGSASFEDLGVDSLMMIEVIAEISNLYKVDLPIEDLEQLTDVDSLVNYLHGRGCRSKGVEVEVDSSDYPSSPVSDSTSLSLSTANTTPTSTPSPTPSASGVTKKLSKLVSEHLELDTELTLGANLADHGLDSLLCIELANDIHRMFHVEIDMEMLNETSTLGDLLNLVLQDEKMGMKAVDVPQPQKHVPNESFPQLEKATADDPPHDKGLKVAQGVFESLRYDFDKYSEQTGFNGFWKNVYPDQEHLVIGYIVETFRHLGCDLEGLAEGQQMPSVTALPKHGHLMEQLRKILVDGGILELQKDNMHVRTAKPIDQTPVAILFERMLQRYPRHSSETKLLNVTGSRLAEFLTGKADPLQLLFANKVNRGIMADVYENAPMCQATTRLLATFLAESLSASNSKEVFRIIEIGAGMGGTARYLVDFLANQGVNFEYTFTDISTALVSQAKKSFSGKSMMKFMALDCDKAPPAELRNKYDVVIATNCIHATKNATSSAANIAALLHQDGIFCLVEFTKGLYWFDLVYGLLEGWWAFSDGRQHALADQWFWDNSLRTAGFKHVSWSDGSSSESQTMRVICGFKAAAEKDLFKPLSRNVIKRAGLPVETFTWKKAGNLELKADVYFPKTADDPGRKRPIALMIHGGGHLLFSRQDIPMKHVRVLLQRGFLPVSVDYRLCPELSLFDGPVTDCCDALQWARETLPTLQLSGPGVNVDPNKLLALGWSSGGQLAMTLGYTSRQKGIKPPDVILPFYSPSDLEAKFWDEPIFPKAAEEPPTEIWGELDCVREEPILEYTPISNKRATALSLTLKDDRARLILHMNWKAQSVPVLIRGLPHKSRIAADDKTDWKALPKPQVEKIRECSPYWHILQGTYRTPTFMVHGNIDDWIPYQMTQKTVAALQERGVPSGILIPDQCGHAFDLFPKEDRLGVGWAAIEAAYDFACRQLEMSV